MEVSADLKVMYSDYYHNETVLMKRRIAARQSIAHLKALLPNRTYYSVIDIGAGDGSVLEELDKANITNDLHAVEISASGCVCIQSKKIDRLRSVSQFDGYSIPADNNIYELGLAIHVLEHVEHERAFLREISRVCEYLYIEVPLELTLKVKRNIQLGMQYGHINFYNPSTFRNLLSSSNLEVLAFKTFAASIDYERYLSGFIGGTTKYFFRKNALKLFSNLAPTLITYMAGAYCRLKK